MVSTGPWQLWVDTGGTFTDCLGLDPEGRPVRAKVLSSSALRARVAPARRDDGDDGEDGDDSVRLDAGWEVPDDFFTGCRFRLLAAGAPEVEVAAYSARERRLVLAASYRPRPQPGAPCEIRSPEEAPVLAARLVTATPTGSALPPMAMRLATTRGTNALLERRGAAVALFVTRGFADLLAIGDQQRPDLFALAVEKPPPLYREVIEVDERLAADGSVLVALDADAVEAAGRRLRAAGIETAAVALLHSYRNPEHERRTAAALKAAGFSRVAQSAELAPRIKVVPRAETAVVEAYLAPLVGDYLEAVAGSLGGGALAVMTSAGGLTAAAGFRAKDSLLSGPAGGVVGAALAGRRSGFAALIAFDMGGTSTDVARWNGDYEYRSEQRVGDARLVAPALAIESVAAGGGSICRAERGQLKVGPESAGATPGPACYGAGGPLTVTDVNLLLGRLDPGRFEIPVEEEAATAAFDAVLASLDEDDAPEPRRAALLAGFLAIADERMAGAIRAISLGRGFDPAEHALVAFGGAGGQHAASLAALLGMSTVLVPPDAGLLSAAGLGAAVVERFAQRQVLAPLAEVSSRLPAELAELADEARRAVAAEGVDDDEIEVRRRTVYLRLAGQEASLAIQATDGVRWDRVFAAAYEDLYGYPPPTRPVEVERIEAVASTRPVAVEVPADPAPLRAPPPGDSRRAWLGGAGSEAGWRRVPVFERRDLPPGATVAGPALVGERHSATVVPPGWRLAVDGNATLVLTRERA